MVKLPTAKLNSGKISCTRTCTCMYMIIMIPYCTTFKSTTTCIFIQLSYLWANSQIYLNTSSYCRLGNFRLALFKLPDLWDTVHVHVACFQKRTSTSAINLLLSLFCLIYSIISFITYWTGNIQSQKWVMMMNE